MATSTSTTDTGERAMPSPTASPCGSVSLDESASSSLLPGTALALDIPGKEQEGLASATSTTAATTTDADRLLASLLDDDFDNADQEEDETDESLFGILPSAEEAATATAVATAADPQQEVQEQDNHVVIMMESDLHSQQHHPQQKDSDIDADDLDYSESRNTANTPTSVWSPGSSTKSPTGSWRQNLKTRGQTQNNNEEEEEASMSDGERTPTKPLLDKLEALTKTWSEHQSNNSNSNNNDRESFSQQDALAWDEDEHDEHDEDDDDDDDTSSKISRLSMASPTRAPSVTNMIVRTRPRRQRRRQQQSSITSTPALTPRRQSPSRTTTTNIPTNEYLFQTPPSSARRERSPSQEDYSYSIGADDSTITTNSSAESVFDRLYRLGMESAQKKKAKSVAQKAALEVPLPPRSYRDPVDETPPRRQAYTPKSNPIMTSPLRHGSSSVRSTPTRNHNNHRNHKNRLKAYTDVNSSHRRQRQRHRYFDLRYSITPRNLNSNEEYDDDNNLSSSLSSSSAVDEVSSQGRPTTQPRHSSQSATSSTTKETSTSKSNSIFSRLYRNEKRQERLWKQPKAFTPTKQPKKSKSSSSPASRGKTPTRSNTSAPSVPVEQPPRQQKPLSIDTNIANTNQRSSSFTLPSPILEGPSPSSATAITTAITSTSTGIQPSPSEETQATNSSLAASLLLDDLLADSPVSLQTNTTAITAASSSSTNLSTPRTQSYRQQRNTEPSLFPAVSEGSEWISQPTTTIDEDLAEIQAIGEALSSGTSSPNNEQDKKELDTLILPPPSIKETRSTSPRNKKNQSSRSFDFNQDLQDIEALGHELRRREADVSRDDSIDAALAEINKIGQELSKASSSSSSPLPLLEATLPSPLALLNASMAYDSTEDEIDLLAEPQQQQETSSELPTQTSDTLLDSDSLSGSIPSTKSGFFSLDEQTGGLVLDYQGPIARISTPIRRRRERQQESLATDQSSCLTPHQLREATAVTLQSAWRRYYAEIVMVALIVDNSSIDWQTTSDKSVLPQQKQIRAMERAQRKLLQDPYLEQGLRTDNNFAIVAWETTVDVPGNQGAVTLSVVVEGSLALDRTVIGRTWSLPKIAHRFLRVGLFREHMLLQLVAATRLQQWARKVLGFASSPNLVSAPSTDNNSSIAPIDSYKSWELTLDALLVRQHQAATQIQNWFRLYTLQSALNQSMETKEELQRVLEGVAATPNHQSTSTISVEDEMVKDARTVLSKSNSMDYWIRDLSTPPKVFEQWTKRRSPSAEEWIERRSTALAVQNIVRTYILSLRRARENRKAILIQSVWRRYRQHNMYAKARRSILQLQSTWRAYWKEIRYIQAAIRLQSWRRHSLAMREWKLLRFSVVTIQSLGRKSIVRKRYLSRHRVALCFQSKLRVRRDRRNFLRLQSAVSSLQLFYRTRKNRSEFHNAWKSAVELQTIWRGFHVRHRWWIIVGHVRRLQGFIRTKYSSQRFGAQRSGAKCIQKHWRGFAVRKICSESIFAAIQIQSLWRQYLARAHRRHRLASLVRLQSQYRAFRACSRFQKSRKGSVLLQSQQRRAAARAKYETTRASTIMVQSVIRGWLSMNTLEFERGACIILQSNWRGYRVRKILHQQRAAVFVLQRQTRMYHARQDYMSRRKSIMYLQRIVRGFLRLKRGEELEVFTAAITVQASWRSHVAQAAYLRSRVAALMVQATFRGLSARNHAKRRQRAIVVIQRTYRAHLTRMMISKLHQEKKQAKEQDSGAKLIQQFWKSVQVREQHLRKLSAIIKLQAFFRLLATQKQRAKERTAAVMIQANARAWLYTTQYHATKIACIKVQMYWRMSLCRGLFEQQRVSAMLIQSILRKQLAFRALRNEASAARTIQKAWASFMASRVLREQAMRKNLYQKAQKAKEDRIKEERKQLYQDARRIRLARRIQKAFREWSLLRRKKAAVLVQSAWRFHQAQSHFYLKLAAAVVIQTEARRQQAMVLYGLQLYAIICIQRTWRLALARERYEYTRASAVILQALSRGQSVRSRQKRQAINAINAQRIWRGHRERQRLDYQQRRRHLYQASMKVRAAKKIQCLVRLWQIRKNGRRAARILHEHMLVSAARIQTVWRGTMQRHAFVHAKMSAVLIQSYMRGFLYRKRFLEATARVKEVAATRIQSLWKGRHVRLSFGSARRSCILIQASIRSSSCLSRFKAQRKAAIQVQRSWRMVIGRSLYSRIRTCVIMIQSLARGTMTRNSRRAVQLIEMHVASTRQHTGREVSLGSDIALRMKSAVKLQACVRSCLARKRIKQYHSLNGRSPQSLQDAGRGYGRQMEQYLKGVVALQSLVRMFLTRKRYWFLHVSREERYIIEVAARRIQLCFLIWKMRNAVLEMQSSAVILHRCMRGQLARSAALFALNHMNSSLQHVPLTPVARVSSPTNVQAKSAFMAWDRALGTARLTAAVVIQTAARRMLARQLIRRKFGICFQKEVLEISIRISENEAASDIQRAFRAWRNRRMAARQLQISENEAASDIQRAFRAFRAWRNRCMAAKQLQRVGKRYLRVARREREKRLRTSAIIIQSTVRRSIAHIIYREILRAKEAAQTLVVLQDAAGKIQAAHRNRLGRRHFSTMRQSAVMLQSQWRQQQVRKSYKCILKAAISIQSSRRRQQLQTKFRRITKNASTIQKWWRDSVVNRQKPVSPHEAESVVANFLQSLEAQCEKCIPDRIHEVAYVDIAVKALIARVKAAKTESEIISLQKEPSYVGYVQQMAHEVFQNFPSSPMRPEVEQKPSTPVRSNKTQSTGTFAENEKAGSGHLASFNDLLQQARKQARGHQLDIPQLDDTSNHSLLSRMKVPLATHDDAPFKPEQLGSEKEKNRSPVPGESFFEGASKEIPSPIKLDSGDWNWADEW